MRDAWSHRLSETHQEYMNERNKEQVPEEGRGRSPRISDYASIDRVHTLRAQMSYENRIKADLDAYYDWLVMNQNH